MADSAVGVVVLGMLLGYGAGFGVVSLFGGTKRKALPPGEIPEERAETVRRFLKHVPRRSIAELQDGTAAAIVGTVRAIAGVAPLRSPLTNTECLGFHVDVRGVVLDHTLRFPQLNEIARSVEIEVSDETGTLRISADRLQLAITDGAISRFDPPLPAAVKALLRSTRSVTVEEGLLHPGSRILVCGVAVREAGGSMLVMRATETFPLAASTDADLLATGEPVRQGT